MGSKLPIMLTACLTLGFSACGSLNLQSDPQRTNSVDEPLAKTSNDGTPAMSIALTTPSKLQAAKQAIPPKRKDQLKQMLDQTSEAFYLNCAEEIEEFEWIFQFELVTEEGEVTAQDAIAYNCAGEGKLNIMALEQGKHQIRAQIYSDNFEMAFRGTTSWFENGDGYVDLPMVPNVNSAESSIVVGIHFPEDQNSEEEWASVKDTSNDWSNDSDQCTTWEYQGADGLIAIEGDCGEDVPWNGDANNIIDISSPDAAPTATTSNN